MDNWHAWRAKGLGASDAPIVMGVSPYKTRYQLWAEKTGVEPPFQGNWATQRGTDMEPKARAHYELMHGLDMPIAFVEHKDFPFIRASLDGYNETANVVLEIKCPGAADHSLAASGKVPEKYFPQLQHQLFASGAAVAHYYSFDGENGHLVIVEPDIPYIKKLVVELKAFWKLIEKKTPPELSDKDYKKIRSADVKILARDWQSAKHALDLAKTAEETARAKLLEACGDEHKRYIVGDVRLQSVTRVGAVDYAKVPALKGVDLEPFRKKSSTFWQVKT